MDASSTTWLKIGSLLYSKDFANVSAYAKDGNKMDISEIA